MAIELTERQKKHLRGLAHGKEPVVMIGGAGLSSGVAAEFENAIAAHELIKVRARVGDRDERDAILAQLAEQSGSALVQRIGNVGVFYRPHKERPRIILPAE